MEWKAKNLVALLFVRLKRKAAVKINLAVAPYELQPQAETSKKLES